MQIAYTFFAQGENSIMKIMALDIGDRWTGIALSDPLHLFANPFTTVESELLISFLKTEITKQHVNTVVVGYPQTLRGTESDQTRKTVQLFETLKTVFAEINWVLIDERLTSKHAAAPLFKKKKNPTPQEQKEEKLKGHARAAAFILKAYLEKLAFSASLQNESE